MKIILVLSIWAALLYGCWRFGQLIAESRRSRRRRRALRQRHNHDPISPWIRNIGRRKIL